MRRTETQAGIGTVGKILLIGCGGLLGLLVLAGIAATVALGLFASKVTTAITSSTQANCLLSQQEASDYFGKPADPPAFAFFGCDYTPQDKTGSSQVILSVHRVTANHSTDQELSTILADPRYFGSDTGQMQPISGLGDKAGCEEVQGAFAHLYFIKGNAVVAVLVTGQGGADCAAAERFARKVVSKV